MISTFFNSSLEIGSFLNTTTSNVTGSDFLTLLIMVLLFFMVGILFHMPELLFAIVIAPLLVTFGLVDPAFTSVSTLMLIIAGVMLAIRMILFR
jgi:hypothetical protein